MNAGDGDERDPPVDADGLAWRVRSVGPGAALLEADAAPSPELSRRLAARRAALWATRPRSVHDLIPSYVGLIAEHRAGADGAEVRRWLRCAVANGEVAQAPSSETAASGAARLGAGLEPRRHEFRVRYGVGADRAELEAALGLPWDELVRLHAGATYTVAFIGFTPGFPYLLGLAEALRLPRAATPRARIPPGGVAIADGQAGIYPRASPGGWWLLGTTDAPLFDPYRLPPALLAAGDEVRFVADDRSHARGGRGDDPSRGEEPAGGGRPEGGEGPGGGRNGAGPTDPALEVVDAWQGAVTLQARPRWEVGHHGLAQAGPLDGAAHAAALDILGARRTAAALELTVPALTLRVIADVTAVVTGGGARVLADTREVPPWRPFSLRSGATLEIAPSRERSGATSYLALGGGLEALAPPTGHPELVRCGSTDARGGIGGFGRALRAGDALALAAPTGALRPWHGRPRYGDRALLRLHTGLQDEAEAFEALLSARFRVASRDRTGARLEGPHIQLARHDVRSQGVPWGAVQVPADGAPIVLLADRGRTGGYAVPGVVDPRDLWQLAQARPGTEVWFVPADPA